MTDLTKFIDREVNNWTHTGSVTLLNLGEYRGFAAGYELDDEIYGPGMASSRVEDGEGGIHLYAYSPEGIAKFVAWAEKNSVHFYADCAEDFFMEKGIQDAIDAGKKYLLVENLS